MPFQEGVGLVNTRTASLKQASAERSGLGDLFDSFDGLLTRAQLPMGFLSYDFQEMLLSAKTFKFMTSKGACRVTRKECGAPKY